jgi:hypothetical protein
MRKFSSYITGLASLSFMFVSAMNARLVFNADVNDTPQLTVQRVRQNYTDKFTGMTHEQGVSVNLNELGKFYGLVGR